MSSSSYACIAMAVSLGIHYFGYECARAASISLLSTREAALAGIAVPLTAAVGFPASALTLHLYTKTIRNYGARFTFRLSNLCCSLFLVLMTVFGTGTVKGLAYQSIVVGFFAFREIYVTLISTQQWSFITSSLGRSKSSFIVTIGGYVGVASTLGSFCVEQIVKWHGVRGILIVATLAMLLSFLFSEVAYIIDNHSDNQMQPVDIDAERYIDGDARRGRDGDKGKGKGRDGDGDSDNGVGLNSLTNLSVLAVSRDYLGRDNETKSVWRNAWALITTHQTLRLLFLEALAHQFFSNTLNLMFLEGLRSSIADDGLRASVVGRFFGFVNFSAFALQLFIVPRVLSMHTLPTVLWFVPVILTLLVALVVMFPSLLAVMFCFGTLKVLEYAGKC